MKYKPEYISDDESQIIISSDIGQLALSLKDFDTEDKIHSEVLRLFSVDFSSKDLSEVKSLLGIEVSVTDKDIQEKKSEDAKIAEDIKL